jgi:amino acid transporter
VGTPGGREVVNDMLGRVHLRPVEWTGHGGFEILSIFTTPLFWLFFLLSGLALFVLRQRDPDIERPFTVPLYPELPLIFCGICGYMIYAGIEYAQAIHLLGGLLAVAGVLGVAGLMMYRLSQWMLHRRDTSTVPPEKTSMFRPN